MISIIPPISQPQQNNKNNYQSPDKIKLAYLKESLQNVELAFQREVREQKQLFTLQLILGTPLN